jgi:mycothiol synthase
VIKLRVLEEFGDDDREELRDLLDAVEAVDDHRALGEHKWLDIVSVGRTHDFRGIVAEEPPHPHPVGYAHLSAGAPGDGGRRHWGLEVAVDPQHRGVGVEVALVEAALNLAAEAGGGSLHFWVFRPGEIHEALAHRLGFARGRELLQMRRPLPHPEAPRWPEGVRVRPFRPGADEEAWLEVNNRAFADHPEQGVWTRRTLDDRIAEDWFDPEGFLLAEDENGLAGFCWTKVHPADDAGHRLGEIYVIATDPSRQGRGLGKALVLGGLAHLAGQGVPTGMLYVDAANEAAVGLYRHLGFDVHHVDRAYVADVPAAGP